MQPEKKFDYNQLIGFILIAILLGVFFYVNQPSEEQLKEMEKQREEQLATQAEEEKAEEKIAEANAFVQNIPDSLKAENAGENITVENDKLKLTFSGVGGYISELEMKGETSYDDKKKGTRKPLHLIKENNNFHLTFKDKLGREINTSQLLFSPSVQKQGSTTTVTMTAQAEGSVLQYVYSLKDGYSVDFEIHSNGLSELTSDNVIGVNWDLKALSLEKGKQQETYWSQTYFRIKRNRSVEYELFGSDKWNEDEAIDWVAFKQQFFTSILSYDNGFDKPAGGSEPLDKNDTIYSKDYYFAGNLSLSGAELNHKMKWDFVPLDYKLLSGGEYEGTDFEDVISFGWGIIGWMNKHFFLNIFQWLAKLGMAYGWVIFLMTIVVKLVLSPIMYKQYKQSATMRILRPEINEINEKFSKKDDAIKKQQATMELYRKAGINPLAGCIPALLQVPIFFALFRFFPNIIDLRGKSFLWADDLTAYDSPILLPDWIPFMDGHISIFAVSYIVVMILYFKVSGTMDNMNMPQQEGMPDMRFMKYIMMYVMPIMFFVFLNSYASSLSWYYLVSNAINIGIVLFIKNVMINDEKIHAKIQENKKKPKKQSKFGKKWQELMEQAQEQQRQQQQISNQRKKKK